MTRIGLGISFLALALACGAFGQPPDGGSGKRGPMFKKGPGRPAFERLNRMSPEERRRFLESLPPERRKRLEEGLARYNQMPPEERRNIVGGYQMFLGLPLERQEALRKIYRRFNELPQDHRIIIRREIRRLRLMPDSERSARMTGEEFRNKFSPDEQALIDDLLRTLPPQ